jgi:hypothetical protein
MTNAIIETLSTTCRGLFFPSETDAPFEAFVWEGEEGKPEKARVLQLAGASPDAPIKTKNLDSFFRDVTQDKPWHNAEEKAEVARFQTLLQTLKKTLADAKVFQVGKVVSDVYIVGRTKSGWAGLKTNLVET